MGTYHCRIIGKYFLYVLLFLMGLLLIHYLMCPVFEFRNPVPFSGTRIHNPYQGIESAVWQKGNFQVQSKAWGGITDGRKNSNEQIFDVYRQLGYNIITISDYQKINAFGSDQPGYVPVYEHGYGIEKNHHVLVGARKVVWNDYPLFQNLNHKQHILNLLRNTSDLVYIAHPNFTRDYPPREMKWLSNYDGIEVLNGFRKSVAHWDSALSAGRYVTILANDDAHDVSNPDEIGQFCTFIHAPGGTGIGVVNGLKKGQAYGAEIPRPLGETIERKAARHMKLPRVISVRTTGDTLVVKMDSMAEEFRFIGQHGTIRSQQYHNSTAGYVLAPQDTYIRTEISYPDGTTFYLNPVARYESEIPSNPPDFGINKTKTRLIRGLTLAGLIAVWILFRRRQFKRRRSYE